MTDFPHAQRMLAFEVAIICALAEEYDAMEACLDEVYDSDTHRKGLNDPNSYTLGKIGALNVALSLLPRMGKEHAASGSAHFRTSFPDMKLCLLVGICAGAPHSQKNESILLGDIIVSTELIQSDFGRQWKDGITRKDTIRDNLGRPSKEIQGLMAKLQTWKTGKELRANTISTLLSLSQTREAWQNPGREHDILFNAEYDHKHRTFEECELCGRDDACEVAQQASCEVLQCDLRQTVEREINLDRQDSYPLIHFGPFSSSDQVIRSSRHRDRLITADGVIGFEMEGAGVWDNFPTIIVKGVSDYADSHKNKKFQSYAAATAAACSKAILTEWARGRGLSEGQLLASTQNTIVAPSSQPSVPVMNNNFAGGNFNANKVFNGGNFNSGGGTMNF